MRITGFCIVLLFAAATYGLWAAFNRPTAATPWPTQIYGFAFSPYRAGQDALKNELPSESQIEQDIVLLSGKADSIRTYSVLGSLSAVPRLAKAHKLNVMLGAWLDTDESRNDAEIKGVIELAKQYKNVKHVVIGNEVVLRGDMKVEALIPILDHARKVITQPVSTAEPWHVWLKNPELAEHVDYLAVHMLPYWEGIDVDIAVDYIADKMQQLKQAFPKKNIVIAEVGWPSDGRTRESAVASEANEALFLRGFLNRAQKEGFVYFLMEAFDQPWKAQTEGGVGAYWGVYDVERNPKFAFVEPIVRVPEWHVLAAISIIFALVMLGVFCMHSNTLATRGHGFLAGVIFITVTAVVWIIYDYTQQYLTIVSFVVGTFLIIGMLGVIVILFTEAHEWAEAHWFTVRRRLLKPFKGSSERMRKVSIHVPAYNEPPDMLIETLNALAFLDYPDFEVLVIDNNTKDESVWRPVERHCASLGSRFRFFHVDPLSGFKAGALNFALGHTHPHAEIVAVIDSDYKVEAGWLKDLMDAFDNPRMAIVQAPQDYRDEQDSLFKAMCYAEYKGFFELGMITRNERNAIIQHGTMTLVRRSVLEELGGWAEWCITEDAELGLRVFKAGYEAAYLAKSYGRGLMPDTFMDFKKQRFRWAYGAMQILRGHVKALFSSDKNRLTPGQRYHFVVGWLPWIADGFNLLFNLAAICWSLAMIWMPHKIDAPLLIFSILPLSLFIFKFIKLVYLYMRRIKVNFRQTIAAAIAGLALSHTIGLAVIKGLLTNNEPFFRTPKQTKPSAFVSALDAVRQEILLMSALWLAAVSIVGMPAEMSSPDLTVWVFVLLVQSLIYFSAVVASFASIFPLPAQILGLSVTRSIVSSVERVTE